MVNAMGTTDRKQAFLRQTAPRIRDEAAEYAWNLHRSMIGRALAAEAVAVIGQRESIQVEFVGALTDAVLLQVDPKIRNVHQDSVSRRDAGRRPALTSKCRSRAAAITAADPAYRDGPAHAIEQGNQMGKDLPHGSSIDRRCN
jgi:hypothetical protein